MNRVGVDGTGKRSTSQSVYSMRKEMNPKCPTEEAPITNPAPHPWKHRPKERVAQAAGNIC